ncbi:MAG: hypothetical protein LBU03_02385 [Tannerellaceae bacterium]|jgi:hypothetical protein|nr:hypothetical protein [Tannerellaceae bacterium]
MTREDVRKLEEALANYDKMVARSKQREAEACQKGVTQGETKEKMVVVGGRLNRAWRLDKRPEGWWYKKEDNSWGYVDWEGDWWYKESLTDVGEEEAWDKENFMDAGEEGGWWYREG